MSELIKGKKFWIPFLVVFFIPVIGLLLLIIAEPAKGFGGEELGELFAIPGLILAVPLVIILFPLLKSISSDSFKCQMFGCAPESFSGLLIATICWLIISTLAALPVSFLILRHKKRNEAPVQNFDLQPQSGIKKIFKYVIIAIGAGLLIGLIIMTAIFGRNFLGAL
ncbi:MAG: hypothetical protein AAB602_00405 [Patescibacteria group bacterium]